jgi:hypothetical protein
MTTPCNAFAAVSGLGMQINAVQGQVIAVQGAVQSVDQSVHRVGHLASSTASRLEQLWGLFVDFIKKDQQDKALQLAETRLIKIRQEIEKLFGVRDAVRRRMLGLLHANDLALVRKETSLVVAEQTLLDAATYWLAPALIGFAGWVNHDEKLAQHAFDEMLRRDPIKGQLFIALLLHRCGRDEEVSAWLGRYLLTQQPRELPRASITLIDAASNGLLPETSCQRVLDQLGIWMSSMMESSGFDAEQVSTWVELLSKDRGGVGLDEYRHLRKCVENWEAITAPLTWARLQPLLNRRFRDLFEQPTAPDETVKARIDQLLESLVTDYEADEVELRIDELLNAAIVDLEGDKEVALERINAYRLAYTERMSIGTLLAVATGADVGNRASVATKKLATIMSRQWILKALDVIQQKKAESTPTHLPITLDGFSENLSPQPELPKVLGRQQAYYQKLENEELSRQRWTSGNVGLLIGGFVGLGFGVQAGWSALVGLVLLAMWVTSFIAAGKRVKMEFAGRRAQFVPVLERTVGEASVYWSTLENMDEVARDTEELLTNVGASVLRTSTTAPDSRRLVYSADLSDWTPATP